MRGGQGGDFTLDQLLEKLKDLQPWSDGVEPRPTRAGKLVEEYAKYNFLRAKEDQITPEVTANIVRALPEELRSASVLSDLAWHLVGSTEDVLVFAEAAHPSESARERRLNLVLDTLYLARDLTDDDKAIKSQAQARLLDAFPDEESRARIKEKLAPEHWLFTPVKWVFALFGAAGSSGGL